MTYRFLISYAVIILFAGFIYGNLAIELTAECCLFVACFLAGNRVLSLLPTIICAYGVIIGNSAFRQVSEIIALFLVYRKTDRYTKALAGGLLVGSIVEGWDEKLGLNDGSLRVYDFLLTALWFGGVIYDSVKIYRKEKSLPPK